MVRGKATGTPAMSDGQTTILASIAEKTGWRQISGPLFRKYVGLFLAVVCIALLSNGVFEIIFSYREHTDALIRIQREQAEGAAEKIGHFIKEIENQMGWTTQLTWSASTIEQRRFDGLRLLRQGAAITQLAQLDSPRQGQMRGSRLAMGLGGEHNDYSHDPKFTEAVAKKVYYGPVYFRRESEPYMTLSLAGTRLDAGVSVAEVNLKLIWDVVSQIKVGEHGQAYVIDADGRLIAHPDISLVLRNTDMTKLAQVQAARAAGTEPVQEGQDIHGQKALSAYAPVSPLGWLVFVELPAEEAYASLYDSIKRSGVIIFAGLVLAFLAGIFLARRMVVPIQMLRAGAQRIGGGDLSQRISIKTGDELEGLADQFNDMANRLQESYSGLERKVELRTRELSEALEQQTASSDILRVISGSPTDVRPVFDSIVASAVRLCGGRMGAVFEFDGQLVRLAAHHNYTPEVLDALNRTHPRPPQPDQASGRAILTRAVAQVEDTLADPNYHHPIAQAGNWRSVLAVPMLRASAPIGAIVITRNEPGPFAVRHVELLKTFADQAVIAIENVRLFDEAQARTDELAKSVEELQALGEVSQAVNSTLDLETVLDTIVSKAVQLSGTEAGAIYVFDEAQREFHLRSTYGMEQELIDALARQHINLNEPNVALAFHQPEPVQVADLQDAVHNELNEITLRAGFR